MTGLRRWMVVVPAVTLVVLVGWLYWTRGTMEQLAFLRKDSGGVGTSLVDQRPYLTAVTLSGLAVSGEEQTLAQQAERLADHEVDQAFAQALRMAAMQQRVLTGAAAEGQKRVEELKGLVKDDQARVEAVTTAARSSGVEAAAGDDADVAKAQLQLDQDELTDAMGDLARESGDRRGDIQQELDAREAALKKAEDVPKKEGAATAVQRYGTLAGRVSAWLDQRSRVKLIEQARVDALEEAKRFAAEHDRLEKGDGAVQAQISDAKPGASESGAGGNARVAKLKAAAARRVVMSILDDREGTSRQMAAAYGQWEAQVWLQHRLVAHLVVQSLAWIAFILLAAALASLAGRALLSRMRATDQRRARTLQTLQTLGLEGLALVATLLVIFGMPKQTPTILGFTGAGLTVVFQDYILAFVGWFRLMGRNGIRVGDWVEIDTVGGEVAEIGLFRTTLLETGNWTSRGHPTGRRVGFSNSFAVRGRYFNFTTHEQWMWDEITLNIPATVNAYELIKRMQTTVEEVTSDNTAQAEEQWQASSRMDGLARFSALPTVDLRPAAAGTDVLIRFVTRANDRFEMRRKLYEAGMGLMQGTEPPGVEAGPQDSSKDKA